ncbi:MAG: AAA family ATPase [Candidatus Bathyarchaeota archaeon]
MSMITDADLLRILRQHNPWWTTEKVPETLAPSHRRRDFHVLKESLNTKDILGLIGARRTGKSTLMYQLVQHLLERVDSSRVMFLKVDDYYLKVDEESIKRIFELYSTNILRTPLEKLDEPIYIFLDEIQSLPEWGDTMKQWLDFGYKIKFTVSSSSSVTLRRENTETLAGCFHPQIIRPMKYLEVVRFKEKDHEKYDEINRALTGALVASIRSGSPSLIYQAFNLLNQRLASERDQLLIYLQQYLMKGGYPELIETEDVYKVTNTLRDYLDQTIYRDIVKTFLIRDPRSFETLFTVLASECSRRLNYSTLIRELGIRKETLKDYLLYLEHSFLITEARFYTRSRRSQELKEKKIYINDVGLRNAVTGFLNPNIISLPEQMRLVTENVVADHCRRLKFELEHELDSTIFHWSDKKSNEVNIVVELFKKPIPIEVKYQERVSESELVGVHEFIERHEPPIGFVVTRNDLKLEGRLIFVPLWLFLFLC